MLSERAAYFLKPADDGHRDDDTAGSAHERSGICPTKVLDDLFQDLQRTLGRFLGFIIHSHLENDQA
jgi:hypothetical protein